jgi:hypothetical protein
VDLNGLNAQGATLQGDFSNDWLYDSDLRGAFVTCALARAHLERADLRGTRFYGVAFGGARVADVKIDAQTSITSSKWWQADFSKDGSIDEPAVEAFFQRWTDKYELGSGKLSANDILGEADSTVRPILERLFAAYLAKKR